MSATAATTAKRIGYALCAPGRDVRTQRDALAARDCDPIYVDLRRPGPTSTPPGWTRALAAATAGDLLVVTAIDRLTGTLADLLATLTRLSSRALKLEVAGKRYDVAQLAGLLQHPLMELLPALISLEVHAALDAALASSRRTGDRHKLGKIARQAVCALDALNVPHEQLAAAFGVSRSTISRTLREERGPVSRPAPPTD